MIKVVKGDATYPQGPGRKIITHCCNDIGVWGAGFVMALSKRWPNLAAEYKEWIKEGAGLGDVMLKQVGLGIFVANVVGQRGVGPDKYGTPPIRYLALQKGLKTVGEIAERFEASIHMPKLGSGLAGGDWNLIKHMCVSPIAKNVDVFVYEYEPEV